MKIYILPIICFVLLGAFAFKENVLLQFAAMAAIIGLFISFILSVIHSIKTWRKKKLIALLPLAITILCGAGPEVGIFLRNSYFRTQLPRLEEAIEAFEITGEFPDVKWNGYMARANKWNGETYATFWWGGGFPVKHTVLLYSSTDDIKDYCKANGWYSGSQLEEKWWVIRD